ncbi:hypothetical protein KUTeg_017716 [Tegillarca granosa]|uniref:Nucleolar protein 6 n=1 Tax=Tegillarca granosa TaxID=220873 RepID=A0ABQ9EFR0_TEGGR|nr:hypothetical protein KUTeg_017716 [Tegillarca granosa]
MAVSKRIVSAKEDWSMNGISLCRNHSDIHLPDLSEVHEIFEVVFMDVTGYVNLCSNMTKSLFYRVGTQVQDEARLAVSILENQNVDGFTAMFMTPVTFVRKFDCFIHIKNLENLQFSVNKLKQENGVLDRGGNYVQASIPNVLSLLQKALDKRITQLQLKLEPAQKAKEFRSFWGDKSELRRFKDGSICEAVMWMDNVPICKKRHVCSKIMRHILNSDEGGCYTTLHAGILPKSVTYISHQLDCVLRLPVQIKNSAISYGTGEEQHQSIIQSYDNLCKLLRNLSDLPLTINSIQGSSPVFRYSEVFPGLPSTFHCPVAKDDHHCIPSPTSPCPPWTPVMKVICVLEGSGKWPDEKEPFRRLKAAFHIKLGEILYSKHSLPVSINPAYVDVKKGFTVVLIPYLQDNYVFRIELAYLREIALLKMIKTADGMLKMRDTEESLKLEKEIVALPKLTSTLHGVQQQNNTYSAAVRLAKRWISSHMLCDYLTDEAVELMMAHVYLHPQPYNTPHSVLVGFLLRSPLVGFLRFLYLLSHHDWKLSPLMINLNNEFTTQNKFFSYFLILSLEEDFTAIPSKFTKERSTLPLMFISTPYDKYSSHWTKKSPSSLILQRLVILARESLNVLEKQLQIFRPPIEDYDVIINLRIKQLPRQHQTIDMTENVHIPVYGVDIDEDLQKKFPVYEYDPVYSYITELRVSRIHPSAAAYDDNGLFFHDKYGGNMIAVLWKPAAFQAQDFKASHINARMPKESSEANKTIVKFVPNVEAIIEDFRILGGGLVAEGKTKN